MNFKKSFLSLVASCVVSCNFIVPSVTNATSVNSSPVSEIIDYAVYYGLGGAIGLHGILGLVSKAAGSTYNGNWEEGHRLSYLANILPGFPANGEEGKEVFLLNVLNTAIGAVMVAKKAVLDR